MATLAGRRENEVRLLVVDDQALFRASLSHLLASHAGFEIVGECGSSAEALEILGASPVDIVLLDSLYATEGGEAFMPASRRNGYQGRFLVITGDTDPLSSVAAIKLGASGVFVESEGLDRLLQAITLVASGGVWLDWRVLQHLVQRPFGRLPRQDHQSGNGDLLTDRERRVLLGVLGGLTSNEIATNLGISAGRVRTSVQQLLGKTGLHTRSQLVRTALEGSLGTVQALIRQTAATRRPANSGEVRTATGRLPAIGQTDR